MLKQCTGSPLPLPPLFSLLSFPSSQPLSLFPPPFAPQRRCCRCIDPQSVDESFRSVLPRCPSHRSNASTKTRRQKTRTPAIQQETSATVSGHSCWILSCVLPEFKYRDRGSHRRQWWWGLERSTPIITVALRCSLILFGVHLPLLHTVLLFPFFNGNLVFFFFLAFQIPSVCFVNCLCPGLFSFPLPSPPSSLFPLSLALPFRTTLWIFFAAFLL